MSVPAGTINRTPEKQLHDAAAHVLEVWSRVDSAAEFIDDSLMPRLREAMAELAAAIRASA